MATQTFNISLPPGLVKLVDKVAKKRFASRSDLIREALVSYVERDRQWNELFALGDALKKKSNISEDQIEEIIDEYRAGT